MNQSKNKKGESLRQAVTYLVGELILGALTVGVLALLGLVIPGAFDYRVIIGALVGALAVSLNFFILTVNVNSAVDKYIEERGSAEMTEEEEAEFVAKHSMAVQAATTRSYILRTLIMLGTLALALFLLKSLFACIATVVPILAQRVVIYGMELINKRRGE